MWARRVRGGCGAFVSTSLPPVSLENVLMDVRELNRGMELTKREYSMHGHNTMLKEFIAHNESKLKKLQDDAKIAQVTRARRRSVPGFTNQASP